MKLKVKKLHTDAILPTYGSDGAGCFDLYAINEGYLHEGQKTFVFPTGLAFEVPPGWVMEINSRSGHGFGAGVRLVNSTGQIDSDFRGDVMVKLTLDRELGFLHVRKGDRVAQAKLVASPRLEFDLVDELSDTARGTGGFGSTGA